ncbi:hypothetical protein [Candidatus Accumulibacter sp. ACC005]|uniref:hypothetical protein n=1 Tax=Candidatus Accumulibacter sp. ACC005 TaxID=2823331 RepID=UPI00342CCE50
MRLIAVLGAIAAPVQEGTQQTESKRSLCRSFGCLVFQPGAHAVGGYLFQGAIQQGQKCAGHRRVALAGPAASGLGFPAGINKALMIKQGALTPLRRTCHEVCLPAFKGRCLDSLRLDSFGFVLGALGVSGRDSVGLLLARVYSLVDQRLQSAGFVAGGG